MGGAIACMSRIFPHGGYDVGDQGASLPTDGSVPGLPGLRWVHTPGHTHGHVSRYRPSDRLLRAGDALGPWISIPGGRWSPTNARSIGRQRRSRPTGMPRARASSVWPSWSIWLSPPAMACRSGDRRFQRCSNASPNVLPPTYRPVCSPAGTGGRAGRDSHSSAGARSDARASGSGGNRRGCGSSTDNRSPALSMQAPAPGSTTTMAAWRSVRPTYTM